MEGVKKGKPYLYRKYLQNVTLKGLENIQGSKTLSRESLYTSFGRNERKKQWAGIVILLKKKERKHSLRG